MCDKFEDSLNRLCADAHLLAGNYEWETAIMLIKAFRESKPAYDVDRVVKQLEKLPKDSTWNHNSDNINRKKAIEIVKGRWNK